jgi:S-adenosylmethionine decarboxylase
LGSHILAKIYGCNSDILNDKDYMEKIMVDSALKTDAEVREATFNKFSSQGVSGVVIISESYLTIHTWPELGYAAVEIKRGIFELPVSVKVSNI